MNMNEFDAHKILDKNIKLEREIDHLKEKIDECVNSNKHHEALVTTVKHNLKEIKRFEKINLDFISIKLKMEGELMDFKRAKSSVDKAISRANCSIFLSALLISLTVIEIWIS